MSKSRKSIGQQKSTSVETQRFDKNLISDINDYHLGEGLWTHARNAINNSKTGDLGKIGNEPSNEFCQSTEHEIIGAIHLISDKWVIFSTNSFGSSEIGVFAEEVCSYETVVSDPCLNFNRLYLIKGVSRARSSCDFSVYWDDSNNPSRVLTLTIDPVSANSYLNPDSRIPWKKICQPVTETEPCLDCVVLNELDCDKIRLAPYIGVPCIEVRKGIASGTLLNGSYQVAVAYAIEGERISDWYISNIQPLFQHMNGGNSLDVYLSNVDQDFDQIIVGLISVTNGQTVFRKAGTYSTRQKQLSFDTIDNTWDALPVEQIPLMTPIVEKTDDMYSVNDYLIRVGTTSKYDFNYQPLANQIVTKWQAVEYPRDYYRKGGNKTNYLRDEVYSFFIRWVYDTGDKSSSYHIPGRPDVPFDRLPIANRDSDPELVSAPPLSPQNWAVYNTALFTSPLNTILDDGGEVVAEGLMGYWESTERYPDDNPEVWDSNIAVSPYAAYLPETSGLQHDLCGKLIRHHKFPDLYLIEERLINNQRFIEFSQTRFTEYLEPTDKLKIRLMGVKFENIQYPTYENGEPIKGIVGYEILRGTRNGNKTILAKGLICNMREYTIPNGTSKKGAFPNYPYNDLNIDPFISATPVLFTGCSAFGGITGQGEINYNPYGDFGATKNYYRNLFTFHSPDTNFTDPYLSAKELKIHGEMYGDVIGKFELSEEHPKQKLVTNLSFYISALAGLGIASLAMTPERSTKYVPPKNPGYGFSGAPLFIGDIPSGPTAAASLTGYNTGRLLYDLFYELGIPLLGDVAGANSSFLALTALNTLGNTTSANTLLQSAERGYDIGETGMSRVPPFFRIIQSIPTFLTYFSQGTDSFLNLIKSIISYKDYALRYHSHGYYDSYLKPRLGLTRRVITDAQYLGPQLTDFGTEIRVNNLFRSKTVGVEINDQSGTEITPVTTDVTRILATDVLDLYDNNRLKRPYKQEFGPDSNYVAQPSFGVINQPQIASSLYTSLKQRIRNQYGQINGVQQFPVSCVFPAPVFDPESEQYIPTSSDTIFGGDTYLGRYTEKNTFFFFYNWLYGQPDGAEFDYTKNEMIPYPRFWANFNQFETGDFVGSIGNAIATTFSIPYNNSSNPFDPNNFSTQQGLVLPNDFYNLSGYVCGISGTDFSVKNSWFYLFSSGVKDFWVESEINVDLRDWGSLETELHYDPYRYTDTKELFKTGIIKSGNYYKYDFSLSISKLWNNYISWGNIQQLNYDPSIVETCFVYRPKRLIYSLTSQFESVKDDWRIFLANNYKDFMNQVTVIKSINKSGALIFFENQSPIVFEGVDRLETDNGVKFVIGDGGLFAQPEQNIVNVDLPIEYGSCQNRLSAINTPFGLYWISQNQGKIFTYKGGAAEISLKSIKWWLARFLPYKLTEDFPDFQLIDNPIAGIGCQTTYDNENGLIYFCKRDYALRKDLPDGVTIEYLSDDIFNVKILNVVVGTTRLNNTDYFEDASWTLSYDPKIQDWVSFHDWHPDLTIPGKNTFLTVVDNTIWRHNERCDSYCNFYGKDYPFEIEFMVNSTFVVNSLRNVEYYMESYKYADNCYDRFHVLDHNFDEAVVFNTEQCSGLLKFVLSPKNDPFAMLQYPIITPSFIRILFSKEENKYRFNQFWDITDDRGEYNINAERVIWNTQANGYIKILNPNNLNYDKDFFERKKFRHYMNQVFLRKNINGNRKILLSLTMEKNLNSPR